MSFAATLRLSLASAAFGGLLLGTTLAQAAPAESSAIGAAPAAEAAIAVPALPSPVLTPSPLPSVKASRELVRRVLLDACVYEESAKEEPATDGKPPKPDAVSARQQKIVDACQCASTRALKTAKDEEILKIDESRTVPDVWYAATGEAYPGCRKR